MKKQLTRNGKQAVCFAALEAEGRNSELIIPEHLWLGLLRYFPYGLCEPITGQQSGRHLAADVLERFGVSTVNLRREIEDEIGETWVPTEIRLPNLKMDARS